jgi:hypothetical protein
MVKSTSYDTDPETKNGTLLKRGAKTAHFHRETLVLRGGGLENKAENH